MGHFSMKGLLSSNQSIRIEMFSRLSYPSKTKHIIYFCIRLTLNIVLLKMDGNYFKNPNAVYEKFINKKWVERKDIMQSKKSFIIEVNKEWNGLGEEQ